MSKTVNKILKEKDGVEHPYSYLEPETVDEARKMFGDANVLKFINYALSVAERRKAYPSPIDIKDLIKSDPELSALYQQKLAEKRAGLEK